MVQEVTIAELFDILHSADGSRVDIEKEYVCNGDLEEYEVKTAVNGNPYVHMTFSDGNKQVVIQFFYKTSFDKDTLIRTHNYRLYGCVKKSMKGYLYFNLLEAPRECKKEKANQKTSDDLWAYPILADEISNALTEDYFYPIFESEIVADVQEPDSKKENTTVEVPSKKIDKGDFIGNLAKELQLKLNKDHVSVNVSIERFEELFEFAIDAGEIERDNFSKGIEYAKQIAMNIEFQLMLGGSSEVTDEIVNEVTHELFGVNASVENVNDSYVGDNQIEVIETKEMVSVDLNDISDGNSEEDIAIDDVIEEDDPVILDETIEESLKYEDVAPVIGNGYGSLYDALKNSGGRMPQKKDEQEQYVDDIETISLIESKLPAKERILYACDFTHVGLVDEKKFKRKSNGFFDVKSKFKDMQYLMLIITENQIICTERYSIKGDIKVLKKDIASVDGIFVKNGFLSLKDSQIQVRLNDNRWFIINKFFTGKDKYDAYLEGLKGLLL